MAVSVQQIGTTHVMAKVEAEQAEAKGLTVGVEVSRKRGVGLATLVVLASFCAPATPVSAADDAGMGAFFRNAFGIGAEPQQAPTYDPGYDLPQDRPVIVRRKRTRTVSRKPNVKIAVGPVAPVSIYEDATLRPGDAVMTKSGIRVFLGGHAMPYSERDFAALSDADGLPKPVEKVLLAINKVPRG